MRKNKQKREMDIATANTNRGKYHHIGGENAGRKKEAETLRGIRK